MIRFRLISVINKHKWLQILMGIIPIIFVCVYMIAYSYDLSSLYVYAKANNDYAKLSDNDTNIIDIDTTTKAKDGYVLTVAKNERYKITSQTNYLYSVILVNNEWVEILTNNLDDILVPIENIDLITDVKQNEEDKNRFTFKIDDKEVEIYAHIAYKVYASDNGYQIEVGDNADYVFSTNLECIKEKEDGYELAVKYNTVIPIQEITYCYDYFETDSTHYDVLSKVALRNLDKECKEDFIASSNIWLTLVSEIGVIMLLLIAYKNGEIKELSKKRYIVMNIISLLLFPLMIGMTYII